jgi:hypothetical protein
LPAFARSQLALDGHSQLLRTFFFYTEDAHNVIKEGWRNWGIDSKRQVEDNNSKKETDKFCQLNFWGSLKKLTKTGLQLIQCDSMYSYPSACYELIQACSRSMISHLR